MRFVHFADDTRVFSFASDINNVHVTVNSELIGVDNWLKANTLSLNVSKISRFENSRFNSYKSLNNQIPWCYT